MKWIGQHIWSFISRFRNDVYLEDISDAGSDTDKFLVAESDGKIAYRTGAEVLSDIGASSESTDLEFNGNTADGVLTYGGAAQIDVESTLTYSVMSLKNVITPIGDFTTFESHATPSGWTSGGNEGAGFKVRLDKNQNTAAAQTNEYEGFLADINDTSSNNVGITKLYGSKYEIDFSNANGESYIYGLWGDYGGGDVQYGIHQKLHGGTAATTYGIYQNVLDGGLDLKFVSSADTDDYFSLATKEDGETTFTTVEDGGGSTAHMNFVADGNIVLNSANALDMNITGATELDTTSFTAHTDAVTFKSATSQKPVVEIQNTNTDGHGPELKFNNTKGGSTDGADSDYAGKITFHAVDDGIPSTQQYGEINVRIHDATSTEESGTMNFVVANHDGGTNIGLQIQGGSADSEVDVNIASGSSSVTTIAGDLDIDGDNMTSAGAMTFTPVGKYTITAPDLTGDVFHLDADADTDNVVNIDAGSLDIDASDNITIDAADLITLTTADTGADGKISLVSGVEGNNVGIHLDADGDQETIVDIDAGVLDIDAATITIDSGLHDITITSADNATLTAADNNTISTTSADGLLTLSSAHTAGQAIHIDGNAHADSEVDIDAGILDINVTGVTTLDTTQLTITGKTLMSKRVLTITPGSGPGEHDGDVVYTGTTSSMTTGDLYVYNASGNWVKANASAENTTKGLLAIALGSDSDTDGMLLRGMVTTFGLSGTQDEGATLYVKATDGDISVTAPSTGGQFVRVVGYCMENSNQRIYFNPDNTYIELA